MFATDVPPQEVYCLQEAAVMHEVPAPILAAIRILEAGLPGQKVRNTNGTFDVGVMQINDGVWAPELRKLGVDINLVQHDACVGIHAGAYVLRKALDSAPNNLWRGVGRYHSWTPARRDWYANRVKIAATYIAEHWGEQLELVYPDINYSALIAQRADG
jgi:hypothetical protein